MAKKKELEKLNLSELLRRTNTANPSKEDMALIRKELDENPKMISQNDPTRMAINRIVEAYINESAVLREITFRHFDQRRKDMGYDDSPWVIQSLIDQVILCEFRLSRFELTHYSRNIVESHTFASGFYYDKALSMAQRRFHRAVETLAKVRRLLSEANYYDKRAEAKDKQANLASVNSAVASQRLYKMLSN